MRYAVEMGHDLQSFIKIGSAVVKDDSVIRESISLVVYNSLDCSYRHRIMDIIPAPGD
jgi:hypothetical protein